MAPKPRAFQHHVYLTDVPKFLSSGSGKPNKPDRHRLMKSYSLCIFMLTFFGLTTTFGQTINADFIRDLPHGQDPIVIKGFYQSTFEKLMSVYDNKQWHLNKKIGDRMVIEREVTITLSTPDLQSFQYLNFEHLHFKKKVNIELHDASIFFHIINCVFEDGLTIN